ncbi:nucleoside 2-deoxyribosyltransferase domain-containing protein [Xanthocytophaga flava]|uniref:nucleoside 2-deoxyribosyltransferase domain-containing protein n=1 Tax=Xanthocytophaga flava TaxID=3048013 RepID=UPI0028D48C42|nr:nucleoside 2-deoxyribosyltransferase domain-containing protein [Xanthocytophaga flavus]MDJ1469777.1 nucleoside 2-deoxyribosyltransferase domain-containing protein [Xanthocytophaga flavus]
MEREKIRVLYARQHQTVFPKLGVFLGGPTPPGGEAMTTGWRRTVIYALEKDERLDPSMVVVAPEPESGIWSDIDVAGNSKLTEVLNKQVPWEWQYLNLCDITAFWLPTYWLPEVAENFPANIGPTTRFELGYYLQEYLKSPQRRKFIIGSPEDAEGIKWAKRITDIHGIKWHFLPKGEKHKLVADSFIEEIATTLVQNKWEY